MPEGRLEHVSNLPFADRLFVACRREWLDNRPRAPWRLVHLVLQLCDLVQQVHPLHLLALLLLHLLEELPRALRRLPPVESYGLV